MWKEKISLEDALEYRDSSSGTKQGHKGRWSQFIDYFIEYENSPSGWAKFTLEEPLSFEGHGLMDFNSGKITLTAVKPVEITIIKWVNV